MCGEVTTYIERLILCAAIQNVLVAAHTPPNTVEGLNHLEAQALALMLLRDGDFFYVTDEAATMDAAMCHVKTSSLIMPLSPTNPPPLDVE